MVDKFQAEIGLLVRHSTARALVGKPSKTSGEQHLVHTGILMSSACLATTPECSGW